MDLRGLNSERPRVLGRTLPAEAHEALGFALAPVDDEAKLGESAAQDVQEAAVRGLTPPGCGTLS